MDQPEYPFTTFNFEVQLCIANPKVIGVSDSLCIMQFAELDGLEMSMEPKTVHEGGNNTEQINLVGKVSYSMLTLKRGMTSNIDLWTWFSAATSNKARSIRANGVIIVYSGVRQENGKSRRVARQRYTLSGCLPVKIKASALNAKDSGIAIEEMQIAVNSFTFTFEKPK